MTDIDRETESDRYRQREKYQRGSDREKQEFSGYLPGTELARMVCTSVAREVFGPMAWFKFRVKLTLTVID